MFGKHLQLGGEVFLHCLVVSRYARENWLVLVRDLYFNQVANKLLLVQIEPDVQGVRPVQPLGFVQRGDWQGWQEGSHQTLDISACELRREKSSLQDESAETGHHFHYVLSGHFLYRNWMTDEERLETIV